MVTDMPWYGWMIAFGIVMVCGTGALCVRMLTNSMRELAHEDEKIAPRYVGSPLLRGSGRTGYRAEKTKRVGG